MKLALTAVSDNRPVNQPAPAAVAAARRLLGYLAPVACCCGDGQVS